MKVLISEAQVYDHERGQEYEVVDATEDDGTFETSDGTVIPMDIDVVADTAIGTLALQDGVDAEGHAK